MRGLRTATAFLTRVPAGARLEDAAGLARSVPWFPVVGALIGLALAAVYGSALLVLPPVAAAAVAVLAGVVLTGAFHEDGLADCADAVGAGSAPDALRILKDPTHGTYGVSALVGSIVLRVAAASALDASTALVALPAAHALSRAAAVTLLLGSGAGPRGLGSTYLDATRRRHVAVSAAAGLTVALVALGPAGAAAATLVAAAAVAVVRHVAFRRIGAVTGDVLGAAQQGAEILLLLLAAAAVSRAPLPVPWWVG